MITGKALVSGVIGYPVTHSRSPLVHNEWLKHYGIDGAYIPLSVRPENIRSVLKALPMMGFRGCNVTIPHKEVAFESVDSLTPRARRAGAVNTVVVHENGFLEGDNTDGFGFLENLRWRIPGFRACDCPSLVLGAGGAARAIVAALVDGGCPEVCLVNRDVCRAEKMAKEMGGPIRVCAWENLTGHLSDIGLLVNTTPLGMVNYPALEIDLSPLDKRAVVNDIVYAPMETALLAQAKALDLKAVDGFGMLLHQARPGFKAWFGVDPVVDQALWDMTAPS